MNIETEKEVKDEDIINLICTAFEGGINYWAGIQSKCRPENVKAPLDNILGSWEGYCYWFPLYPGGSIQLKNNEEVKRKCKPLNSKTIAKGFQVMSEKYPKHFNDFISDNADATTADVFIQCCVFEDVIYG